MEAQIKEFGIDSGNINKHEEILAKMESIINDKNPDTNDDRAYFRFPSQFTFERYPENYKTRHLISKYEMMHLYIQLKIEILFYYMKHDRYREENETLFNEMFNLIKQDALVKK